MKRRQQGAALLTAMVIVVLISTLASAMVWQQWRAVQVEAAERARVQAAWMLSGAIDWARLILREDARDIAKNGPGKSLNIWSQELKESRVSSFLAVDQDNTDDAPPAFLSGGITDAQARYNLRNLIENDKILPAELALLQALFESIGVAPDLAQTIATGLREAGATTRSASTPLMPQRVDQLAWFGIDAASLARITPYVVLLPGARTLVNLNTASREVLAAVIGLDLAGAERLRLRATSQQFKDVAEAKAMLGATGMTAAAEARLGVQSNFFEVRGRLRLEDRVLEETYLVQRNNLEVFTIQRERVNSREPGA